MSKFADVELYRQRAQDARNRATLATDKALFNFYMTRAASYEDIIVSRVAMTTPRCVSASRTLAEVEDWMPKVRQFYEDVHVRMPLPLR
ncbi:MAG: hypothetical protein ACRYG4_03110 [Janthinobacterium lividum]